jgi:hypothetical protein
MSEFIIEDMARALALAREFVPCLEDGESEGSSAVMCYKYKGCCSECTTEWILEHLTPIKIQSKYAELMKGN